MGPQVLKPISQDSDLKDHIFQNLDFLNPVLDKISSEKLDGKTLSLDVGIDESQIRFESQDSHHASCTLRYVIDGDASPFNGRIYLEDRFDFDPTDKNSHNLVFSRKILPNSSGQESVALADRLDHRLVPLPQYKIRMFYEKVILPFQKSLPPVREEEKEIGQGKTAIDIFSGSGKSQGATQLYPAFSHVTLKHLPRFSPLSQGDFSKRNILTRSSRFSSENVLDQIDNLWSETVKDPFTLASFFVGASSFRVSKFLGLGFLNEFGIASGVSARTFVSLMGVFAEASAFEAMDRLHQGRSFEGFATSALKNTAVFGVFHASGELWKRMGLESVSLHLASVSTFHGVNELQRALGWMPTEMDYSARLLLDLGFYAHATAAGAIAHQLLGPEMPLLLRERVKAPNVLGEIDEEEELREVISKRAPDTEREHKSPVPLPEDSFILRSIHGEHTVEAEKISENEWNLSGFVRVSRDEHGRLTLKDMRTPSRKNAILTLNGSRVKMGEVLYLTDRALIKIGDHPYYFFEIKSGLFEQEFYRQEIPAQNREWKNITEAESFDDLKARIRATGFVGADQEVVFVEECLSGKRRLDFLSPLVRAKVMSLMEEANASLKPHLPQGFDVALVDDHPLQGGLRTEQRYHAYRAAVFLRDRIQTAKSVGEMIGLLRRYPLNNLEGSYRDDVVRSLEDFRGEKIDFRMLPKDFGIQQRVSDLEETKYYRQHQMGGFQLDPSVDVVTRTLFGETERIKQNLLGFVRGLGPVRGSGKTYKSTELLDLVHEVLERGKPLEMIPTAQGVRGTVKDYMNHVVSMAEYVDSYRWKMSVSSASNAFTGEKFGSPTQAEQYLQAQYRFARMLMNQRMGLPLFGEPTEREKGILTHFSKRVLHVRGDVHYADAQEAIRDHLQRFSPEVQEGLRKADQETRALVMETFFGISQHRYMFDPYKAFEVANFLGDVGFYRELGVTLEVRGKRIFTNLSLGDLGSVHPEKDNLFFVFHTHPEEYLNHWGQIMGAAAYRGQTMVLDVARTNQDTRNVMFSQQDIRLFKHHAESIFQLARTNPQLDLSIFYDRSTRIFRNWVRHPYGMAEVRVYLNPYGVAEKIEVDYGVKSEAQADTKHLEQADRLRAMSQELHIPVEVLPRPIAQLEQGLPYLRR